MERKINCLKALRKKEEKMTSRFSSFLSLVHCELTKSCPFVTARIEISDRVRVWYQRNFREYPGGKNSDASLFTLGCDNVTST